MVKPQLTPIYRITFLHNKNVNDTILFKMSKDINSYDKK